MTALVTGATGFVGANVVRALLDDGQRVRALVRRSSDRRAIEGLALDVCEGDLLDPGSLRGAVTGARHVYHVAADYRLWARDPRDLYRANVDGTRAVLAACADAGVERVVYTSTVGALGIPEDGSPGTETTPVTLADMVGPYKRSKFLAERVALEWASRGLPVVVVNPSAPVGPWDTKPTPTGQLIVDSLRGKMFPTRDTGLTPVPPRAAARGLVLAAERARAGRKNIRGNQNLSLSEIFGMLARLTGHPAPRIRVPWALAWCGALGMEAVARLTGGVPAVPLTAVRMARKRMHFSAAKAVRELGLPQTPVEDALRDAVEWFAARGYGIIPGVAPAPTA